MSHDKPLSEENGIWPLVGWLSGVIAAVTLRRLIDSTWRATRGDDPPKDPSSRHVSWQQAFAFGALTGAAAGVARVVGRRVASHLADR